MRSVFVTVLAWICIGVSAIALPGSFISLLMILAGSRVAMTQRGQPATTSSMLEATSPRLRPGGVAPKIWIGI